MKIKNDNIEVSDEFIEIIAKRVKANIRELEGVLNKVIAYSSLSNKTVTKEMLLDIISEFEESKPKKVLNIDSIIYEIAKYYDLDPKIIKSNTRKQEYILIRQIAMYVIREVTEISLNKVGEGFGGKNHATVLHSIEKIETKIKEDENFKNEIGELIATIKNMF